MIAGHGFERVGLVKDHDVVVGQDARPFAAQRQVAEKQRMVDDQHLRVFCTRRRA